MMVLQADNLMKSFGAGAKLVQAVKGVSLSMKRGEILAFLGRNGAGKTTTIKMIAGLLEPDSGSVSIGGLNPARDRKVYEGLGTVLEGSRNLYMQLTTLENLHYFAALKGMNSKAAKVRADELLAIFDLSHKAHARVRELSRGMQQKVSVAVSLVHSPQVLLLDEPTNGLDVEASNHIKQMLRHFTGDGLSVLLTTHQLDVAQELADRVAVIRDGVLVAEESTGALIERFSGNSITVVLAQALSAAVVERLGAVGVTVDETGKQLSLAASSVDLYVVLDLVRPVPVLSVEKRKADLSDVFLSIVQEGEGGQS
ncbi:MAG: ABC transporter ATP-binding protein [Candidatus Obscuribacterales bacterium]|nr:ABC transporter ATP-binding protein [Candidatus Obscuribacterales bacterium]